VGGGGGRRGGQGGGGDWGGGGGGKREGTTWKLAVHHQRWPRIPDSGLIPPVDLDGLRREIDRLPRCDF